MRSFMLYILQIRTRNTVERSYGVLKRRFPVLSTGMGIQVEKVQDVIVACCILHNIAVVERDPEARPVPHEFESVHDTINRQPEQEQLNDRGINNIRHYLVNNYFAELAQQQ